MPGHRAYRAWFVIAAVVSLEVLLGRDRTVVDYDGGDNEARALFFCMNHGVGEDENCVERLVLAARERNETYKKEKTPSCDYQDTDCVRTCGSHDTKVGGDNRATIEAFSEYDDYFDAEPWRPQGQDMVDAVYKHIVEDGSGYVVFPRYLTEDQTRQMREEHDRLFNGGDCVQRPDSDAGVGTIWAAEAYSPVIDAFAADESLRAAAIKVMNQSEHGRALLAEGFVEVTSTAFYQNMAACSYENEYASPLCGIVSVSPALASALESLDRPRASPERQSISTQVGIPPRPPQHWRQVAPVLE